MDPAYLYKLPEGTRIFRATTLSKEGRWYAHTLEDAYTYGSTITEYSTVKDLKFLNIMSLTFHLDLIDRLNVLYPGKDGDGIDADKQRCLIPLGLMNLQTQETALHRLGFHVPIDESRWDNTLEYLSQCMLNRHRCSDHTMDAHMITVLERIYGDHYDGIISPLKWPTKMHGYYFPREICMFKLGNVKEEAEHVRPSNGGGRDVREERPYNFVIKPHLGLKYDDELKKRFDAIHKESSYGTCTLFWNPHTDDDPGSAPTSKSVLVPLSVKKRKTRKRERGGP